MTAAAAVLLIAVGLLVFAAANRRPNYPFRALLRERGRIAVAGEAVLPVPSAEGTELIAIGELPGLERAIHAGDAEAVTKAMTRSGITGLLITGGASPDPGDGTTVLKKLRQYDHVPGFCADFLAPEAALFLPCPTPSLRPDIRQALGVVARALLAGARAPGIDSFPKPLKSDGDFEVMVLLSKRGFPRLWRSARASSMARALIKAATAARRRWNERERLMGVGLDRTLARLDVEVSLLVDDGTIASRDRAFIERVVSPVHGIGYEEGGRWRYLLPEARRRLQSKSVVEAYLHLFRKQGLPESALDRADIRLYRLVAVPLTVSPTGRPSMRSSKAGRVRSRRDAAAQRAPASTDP